MPGVESRDRHADGDLKRSEIVHTGLIICSHHRFMIHTYIHLMEIINEGLFNSQFCFQYMLINILGMDLYFFLLFNIDH